MMTVMYSFKMYCKSLCEKYIACKTGKTLSYYSQGYKLCKECELFLDYSGTKCLCCNFILITKPHNSLSKHKLRLCQSFNMV